MSTGTGTGTRTRARRQTRTRMIYGGSQPKYVESEGIDAMDVDQVVVESERHLYVPSQAISFESQCNHAIRLIKAGNNVFVHRHAWGQKCRTNVPPHEGCVRNDLTAPADEPKLVPVTDTDPQGSEIPSENV